RAGAFPDKLFVTIFGVWDSAVHAQKPKPGHCGKSLPSVSRDIRLFTKFADSAGKATDLHIRMRVFFTIIMGTGFHGLAMMTFLKDLWEKGAAGASFMPCLRMV
ncbi:MAG: hypothetical protein GY749_20725, partial [Desulfobacteraceae bacterium]|nr:hypothetical protein [Desulfobacteraceae bacterium]